jgi:hypothetical protein
MEFRFTAFAACALFGIAPGTLGQPAAPEREREAAAPESSWTVVVIKLQYADAEQVAAVLRELLPPTVRVVPYYPTNSVLISGDRAVIGDIESQDPTKEPTNN